MKILHVLQGTVGGTIEFLNLLVHELENMGYTNVVVCPSYSGLKEKCMRQSIECIDLDMGREISLINDFAAVMTLIKIIRQQRCDVVHAHSSKAGAVGRLAAFLCNVPCIYTAHGWSFNMRVSDKKKTFYGFVERYLSYITNMITCISQHEVDSAIAVGIHPEKLVKINNSIDILKYEKQENVSKLKERLHIPNNKTIVGMVARISEQKDPLFFLDIAIKLKQKIKDSYFILVGDGELREILEKKIKSCEDLHDRVMITGWVSDPEIYIKCFDIALLTSKWEGFGMVLLEYMACRIPVIASKVDGIPYVVEDGHTGFLCESGNIESFIDKICLLIDNKQIAEDVANNAYIRLHVDFSISKMAKSYSSIYQSVIK